MESIKYISLELRIFFSQCTLIFICMAVYACKSTKTEEVIKHLNNYFRYIDSTLLFGINQLGKLNDKITKLLEEKIENNRNL